MPAGKAHVRKPSFRRAFSVVELVFVVAASALLLGQVAPAVKKTRQTSLQLSCQDRLGRIARASLVYAADDPHENAVPIGTRDGNPLFSESYASHYNYGRKSGLGPSGNPIAGLWGGPKFMGSPHRPLNRILYKTAFTVPDSMLGWPADARLDLDVYRCPADDGFPGMHHRGWRDAWNGTMASYDYYGTSYANTVLLLGYISIGQPLLTNSPYARPVLDPAKTVLYWENAARFAYLANNSELDQSGRYWPYDSGDFTANGWHGMPFHFFVSFVDGHTAWMEIKGCGRTTPPPNMPPSCSGGVCDCVFIRGPGWQMDTLPADLLPTYKRRSSGSGTEFEIVDQ